MKVFEHSPIFCKTTLKNGTCIATEHHPHSRAVSSGIFFKLGSRDEIQKINGAVHFIEHLVFKGTKKRSAYEIAQGLESLGGELNAYTSKENTCFHASCLKEHLNLSLDILIDLVGNAQFKEENFNKERSVICQEINMSMDLLEEYIFDVYFQLAFKDHSLSMPILGTEDSLNKIKWEELTDFYKNQYHNFTLGVAGNVNHEEVVKETLKYLNLNNRDIESSSKDSHLSIDQKTLIPSSSIKRIPPTVHGFTKVISKPSEQVHLLMGLPSASHTHPSRFTSYVVNAYLGGGMTSKLYQIVREKHAYAYSIYSYLHPFTDSGFILFYAGTSEENLSQVYKIIVKEIEKIKSDGISKKDLEYFKTQVIGNVILGADDIDNRMNSLGFNQIIFGQYQSVEGTIAQIQSLTTNSIQEYTNEFFDMSKLGTLVMGDVDSKKMTLNLES